MTKHMMGQLSRNRAPSSRLAKAFIRCCNGVSRARVGKLVLALIVAMFAAPLALPWVRVTAVDPSLLIYVPINLQSMRTLSLFMSCIAGRTAVMRPREFASRVDVLFVTSGNRTLDARENRQIAEALNAIKHAVPSIQKARATHVILKDDTYDKTRPNSQWVAGPNELFYRVMSRDGDVHRQLIGPQAYGFVQQMETDVCPIRDGWLEALVSEVYAASLTTAVISGARVESDTLCSPTKGDDDECRPASKHPEYIRQHINGNAMYRMGDRLQSFLDSALERYKPWPFDLAAYLTANATGQLYLLRPTRLIHNRVVPVHAEMAYSAALYDPATYFVHCSSNFLKPTQKEAAFATLSRGSAVIVIDACESIPQSILANLHLSLQRLGVRNIIWAARSGSAAAAIVRDLRPLAFVESEERASSAHASCTPPFDVIEQLINRQHDVFCLHGDAVGVGDFATTLESLDRNATHFASAAVQSHGHYYDREPHLSRYKFTSKAFFMPATAASLGLIQTWRGATGVVPHLDADTAINAGARCSTIANCTWNGSSLRVLSPNYFISGPNLVKQWPSSTAMGKAVVFFDTASNGGASGRDNRGPSSEGHARFRLQHMGQWLLPRSKQCCKRVLVAPDVKVGEDAATVRAYVDLLLQMNKTAARTDIGCVVTPVMLDSRTGERVTYDVIFDPTTLFVGSHVYPSIGDAPLCPRFPQPSLMINASVSDIPLDGWRTWPQYSFTSELRNALGTISRSSALASSVCVDDSQRSLAEAALHLIRGSARAILQQSPPSTGHSTYAMGKWRVLDSHVQRRVPGTLTLLSPRLYPGTTPTAMYTAFGLRAQYPRLGEDVVMDVLDALVCQLASNVTKAEVPDLDMSELYAGLLELVDPDVLSEDLALAQTQSHIADLDAAPEVELHTPGVPPIVPRTYLIPLDTLANNGFSNTVNSAQVLAYLASKTKVTAVMVPLSIEHRAHAPRPWSDVLANVTDLYAQQRTFAPPIWAMLRHPSLLVEVLDGYMLPAGNAKEWAHNATCRHVQTRLGETIELPCMAPSDVWNNITLSHHSPRLFRRLHVASSAAEHERLLLTGHDAVIGSNRPYLGLSDEDASSAIAARTTYHGRDIAFRPFRALDFQNTNAEHVEFARAWRTAFTPARSLTTQADAIVQGLAPNFACYHARVADEFVSQHRAARPHFSAETVFKLINQRVKAHDTTAVDSTLPGVYLTSDVVDPVSAIGNSSTSAVVTSCRAFGCSDKDHVGWGIIDRLVCASAATFLGNIYSTFTLSVCALRNDQTCRDLYGQALSDGRLLF